MRVKICGLTNLADARIAAAAGADYLGFIFYPPSPRAITPAGARAIVDKLRRESDRPPVMVGVFVNESAAVMAEILAHCRLDLAQLSGDEVPFLVGDVRSPLYGRSYKAIRPATAAEAEAEAEWYAAPREVENGGQISAVMPSLLVDAYHPTLRGGTGEMVSWDMVSPLFQNMPGIMLAGGLTPENVAEAGRRLRPFAVDVASGVEAAPGRKDHEKVRAFIVNAQTSL